MFKRPYLFIYCSACFLAVNYAVKGQDSVAIRQDSLHLQQDSLHFQEDVPDSAPKDTQLQKFRRAFEKVVGEKKIQQKQKKKVKKDPTLNLGVMILDQTRTKMGRDFYNLFYRNWQSPDSTGNFTITISEKPLPGLGSLISVKVDYKKVYRARLQPKRRYIKAVSKQAIARCQKIIRRKAKVRRELAGY
jgi:curli production assembly/transport component CsgE